MPRQYRTREGEATAVDTKTQLTTLGSEAAPGPILVPAGAKRLVGLIVAASENFAAATSYGALVRLEGPGLPEGPEVFGVATGGVPVATGGNGVNPATMISVDIPVTPANEILIFGEMVGTDVGQVSIGVTLIFAM